MSVHPFNSALISLANGFLRVKFERLHAAPSQTRTSKQYILKIHDLCSVLALLSQDSFLTGKKFRPSSVRSNDRIPSTLLRRGLEEQVTSFWTPCIFSQIPSLGCSSFYIRNIRVLAHGKFICDSSFCSYVLPVGPCIKYSRPRKSLSHISLCWASCRVMSSNTHTEQQRCQTRCSECNLSKEYVRQNSTRASPVGSVIVSRDLVVIAALKDN
jgi:hypothetical protein